MRHFFFESKIREKFGLILLALCVFRLTNSIDDNIIDAATFESENQWGINKFLRAKKFLIKISEPILI